MRIAIVIDSLNRGGAEHQALNATLELTRRGSDVELIHYYPRADDVAAYEHPALHEARVTCLPKSRQSVRFVWRLAACFRSRRFDVVHAFKETPSIYCSLAGRLAGTPVVLGGCRVEYDGRGLVRLAHRLTNYLVTGWIVNSRAIVESIVKAFGADPGTCHVVYNGLDPDGFVSPLSAAQAKQKLGLDPVCATVSILAQLRPQKNHALFLDMAGLVLQQRPGTRFLVAGDGELRPSLEAKAAELGIARSLLFLGNRADVADILAATDVSVLTSHYEGLANALLESMAARKPVVTTDYAGVQELVSDGQEGFITPRGDAQAMAGTVVGLLNDANLRQTMGERGRKLVEQRFSMTAMGTRLLSVYRQCLEAARARSRCRQLRSEM